MRRRNFLLSALAGLGVLKLPPATNPVQSIGSPLSAAEGQRFYPIVATRSYVVRAIEPHPTNGTLGSVPDAGPWSVDVSVDGGPFRPSRASESEVDRANLTGFYVLDVPAEDLRGDVAVIVATPRRGIRAIFECRMNGALT